MLRKLLTFKRRPPNKATVSRPWGSASDNVRVQILCNAAGDGGYMQPIALRCYQIVGHLESAALAGNPLRRVVERLIFLQPLTPYSDKLLAFELLECGHSYVDYLYEPGRQFAKRRRCHACGDAAAVRPEPRSGRRAA